MAKLHALRSLLVLPNYLHIIGIHAQNEDNVVSLMLALTSVRRCAYCPLCHRSSRRIHSHYVRTLADLPFGERTLTLHLNVRRFFCHTRECPRRIFAERLPELSQPYARRTQRQRHRLERIGLALGGRAGARLASELGLPLSFKTLLRFVLASPSPHFPTPRVLGVDDWAFRKGHRYGTLLYDLQTHHPVELLPDRTAASLTAWLKAHPGVEIISRDRASAYSEGAKEGAPHAVQVADRFHLLKNLGDTLQRLLNRKRSVLKQLNPDPRQPEIAIPHNPAIVVAGVPRLPLPLGEVPDKVTLRPFNQAERASQHRRLERYLRYDQVRELYRQGYSVSQIAHQMQLTAPTIRKFVRADTFPERSARTGDSSQLDAYKPYLRQRWQEGCHNASTLWKELGHQGYWGGYTLVKAYLQTLRQPSKLSRSAASAKEECSVRDVVTALLRPEPDRSAEERSLLERLDNRWEPFRRFHASAQAFIALVRAPKENDQSVALTDWIITAQTSEVADLVSFAASIKKDKDAVVAGLSLSWSNGAVEGSVNRLKMIKRQMYGRASFALLRRRVLEPTEEAVGHHRE